MLSSPAYSHQAISALKEAGPPCLQVLETAFHKSGQSDIVMLKIIQIIGTHRRQRGIALLWKKVDYPDKRIVKQILYSLRFITTRPRGREVVLLKICLIPKWVRPSGTLPLSMNFPKKAHFIYLREAISEEILENYDQITLLLSLIYDPASVQLRSENILAEHPTVFSMH